MKTEHVRPIVVLECPFCDSRNDIDDLLKGKCFDCEAKIDVAFTNKEDDK